MAYQRDASKKEINTDDVIQYLGRAFKRATTASSMSTRAVRTVEGRVEPTELYSAQVELCYMVDNIQRGPAYIAPKIIQAGNEMIAKINDN